MKIPDRMKRTLALILTVSMLLALMPAGAAIADESEPGNTPALAEPPAADSDRTPESQKTAMPETTGDAQNTQAPVPSAMPVETQAPEKADGPAATPAPTKAPAKTAVPEEEIEQNVIAEDEVPPEVAAGEGEDQAGETLAPEQKSTATVAVRGAINWNGFAGGAEKPAVKITLLRNGVSASGVAPIVTKDTSYGFTGLAKYDETGDAYSYKIKVSKITGYTVSTSGNDITVMLTAKDAEKTEAPSAGAGEEPGDAAVQAVIEAIAALPAAADADLLDNTLSSRVSAASDALDALTDEQYAKIPQELVTKLEALLAVFFAADGGISLLAVQTDVVTVKAVWAGDISAADRRDVTIALSGFDADGGDLNLSAALAAANGWTHRFTGVNALRPHAVAAVVSSGYTANVVNPTGTSVTINIQKAPVTPTDLKVKLVWSGISAPAGPVTVMLAWTTTASGGSSETLSLSGSDWSGTFTQKNDDAHTFLLAPQELAGYTSTVSFNSAAGLYTVTYKKAQSTIAYSGNLVWWPSEPVSRGNVQVTLVRTNDGRTMGSATLPDGDNTFTFADVPQYMDNGNLCIYGVRASDVTGFTKSTDTDRSGHAKVIITRANPTISTCGSAWPGGTTTISAGTARSRPRSICMQTARLTRVLRHRAACR